MLRFAPALAATLSLSSISAGVLSTHTAMAQSVVHLRVVVNSNQDSVIQADGELTLREAIALVNGTLLPDQLSATERIQVEPTTATSHITFDLPSGQTTILLTSQLPDLEAPHLIIDGTTQPGYDASSGELSPPIVAIAPASQTEILRGLTITADHITIRGLSLYGFTSTHRDTASTPPADIFISHRLPPPDRNQIQPPDRNSPFRDRDLPPQNVVIENNWLGISPSTDAINRVPPTPIPRSAFGVYVFNTTNTIIQNNYIANHDGSGIITAVNAENLQIRENQIENNGIAGIPDAIRLEGQINNTRVESNQIRGNAGSGVFLFKPEGSVVIRNNQIESNGRRLRRAAIHLLGSGHQVIDNVIQDQPGEGVVVGAFPRSDRNIIQNNRFARLTGLSIDLIAQLNTAVEDFQRGDGLNPQRNSPNRRRETGNAAINTPEFLSPEFLIINGQVNIDGVADPNSQIDLYQVNEPNALAGPLSEPIATTITDAEGRFSFTLDALPVGTVISAIATDPQYGTSEPARNAIIRAIAP